MPSHDLIGWLLAHMKDSQVTTLTNVGYTVRNWLLSLLGTRGVTLWNRIYPPIFFWLYFSFHAVVSPFIRAGQSCYHFGGPLGLLLYLVVLVALGYGAYRATQLYKQWHTYMEYDYQLFREDRFEWDINTLTGPNGERYLSRMQRFNPPLYAKLQQLATSVLAPQ
jgi:hypothetical protein